MSHDMLRMFKGRKGRYVQLEILRDLENELIKKDKKDKEDKIRKRHLLIEKFYRAIKL